MQSGHYVEKTISTNMLISPSDGFTRPLIICLTLFLKIQIKLTAIPCLNIVNLDTAILKQQHKLYAVH